MDVLLQPPAATIQGGKNEIGRERANGNKNYIDREKEG
jgi:hypothetical protein